MRQPLLACAVHCFEYHNQKSSLVVLRLQCTLFRARLLSRTAPGLGHSATQQPQYQHSHGYAISGCFPLAGFGSIISTWQTSRHLLHPLQISESKVRGRASEGSGNRYTLSLHIGSSLRIFPVVNFIIFFESAVIVDRNFLGDDIAIP